MELITEKQACEYAQNLKIIRDQVRATMTHARSNEKADAKQSWDLAAAILVAHMNR